MLFRRLVCVVVALTALLAFSASSVSAAAAVPATDATASAKRKNCKGKKKAAKKGKKCKKKKKKKAPKATGPQIPAGDYTCGYYTSFGYAAAGSVQILAGNRYTVNKGTAGSYKYFPDTGVMQFPTGDYSSFYAVYDGESKLFEVYAAEALDGVEIGDYGWTCNANT